jgi:hypothetical protein
MRSFITSFARNTIENQSGQVLPLTAVVLVALMGLGGLGMDFGRAYIAQARLQTYANAAALAAAGEVYNTSTTNNATTYANDYSASTGDENAISYLGTVTTSVTTKCLNLLLPSGSTCTTGSPANAVQVTESASIPTTFMAVLGKKTINISAIATASMQGKAQPWNVAIILDATGSMSSADTNCGGVSEFKCATNGIAALLAATDPCQAGASSCTSAAANFRVALFSFPGVSTTDVSNDTTCSSAPRSGTNNVEFMEYTLPYTTATSYAPLTYETTGSHPTTWQATYNITYGASDADANGFVADYYNSTASNGLNSSSSLVKAITTCMQPIQQAASAPQIQGASQGGITYYASAIYAAQSALVAEQTVYPKSKNAIIFLSDGQANLVSATGDFPTAYNPDPSGSALNTLNSNGTYPSAIDECQQAIIAAQAATTAGTTVFGVAYGSEDSGCYGSDGGDTDTTLIATGKNSPFTLSQLSPCVTIENIASSLNNFYSDYLQSGSGVSTTCVDNSHSVVSLEDIFLSIAASFTNPRLLPNNAK